MPRRPDDFRLSDALRAPGFTPAVADVPALLALLAGDDEDERERAERALGRMDQAAAHQAALRAADDAGPPLRARLCRVLGRLAQRGVPGCVELLLARLTDEDDPTRRAAAVALGRLGAIKPGAELEAPLVAAWDRERRPEHRRALAEALGKAGGAQARSRLDALQTDDPELRRLAGRARLMLDRTAARGEPERLRLDRGPPRPLDGVARCRPGLEELLRDELGPRWSPRVAGPGEVRLRVAAPPAAILAARTLLSFGILLPLRTAGADLAEAVATALTGAEGREVFFTFTEGTPRFRLAWAGGGHRRALVWRCAQLVQERCPGLRNDPTGSSWEVVVHEGRAPLLELRPRPADERFAYRSADVPAASHPTVAAALARAAGVAPGDRVWDPFCGSGLELAERALLGPYEQLCGSDLDERALEAARRNLAAAGVVGPRLVRADACAFDPGGPSLILTNPPMGRRVRRDGSLGDLLDRFADHAGRVLRPGGRLVWLSPLPARTAERLRAAGLRLTLQREVDMGGFRVELQAAHRGPR